MAFMSFVPLLIKFRSEKGLREWDVKGGITWKIKDLFFYLRSSPFEEHKDTDSCV